MVSDGAMIHRYDESRLLGSITDWKNRVKRVIQFPSRKLHLPVATNYRSRTGINYIEVDVYYAAGSLFR